MNKKNREQLLILYTIFPSSIGIIIYIYLHKTIHTLYKTLTTPKLTPPIWIFLLFWLLCYLIVGIASYGIRISYAFPDEKQATYTFNYLQLFMMSLWFIFFFRFHLYAISGVILFLLLFLGGYTAILNYRLAKTSGFIYLLYLPWILFSCYFSFSISIMN